MKGDEKEKFMYILKNPEELNEMSNKSLTRISNKKYSLVGQLESIIGKTFDSNLMK